MDDGELHVVRVAHRQCYTEWYRQSGAQSGTDRAVHRAKTQQHKEHYTDKAVHRVAETELCKNSYTHSSTQAQ